MIQTHKLTIIPIDGTVVTDMKPLTELDLSGCEIPSNIHALQWNNPIWPDEQNSHLNGLQYGQGTGWIEFRSSASNIEITELPQWAINCYNVWLQKYNENLAAEAAENNNT
jgi:hypothetical protein